MRNIFTVVLITFSTLAANAQWGRSDVNTSVTLTNVGDKVGIGVILPLEKLHIDGAIRGNSTGGSLRISTGNGFVDLGPQSTEWSHFNTDRAAFLFLKPVYLNNGLLSSATSTPLRFQIGGSTKVTIEPTFGNVGLGIEEPMAKLHIVGDLLLDGANSIIHTSTASGEVGKFLQISNSPLLSTPAGLKAGGLLVADSYSYANPNKNTLIVKSAIGIGNNLASNPNGYSLLVNGKVNASSFFINDQVVVSSQWVTSGSNVYFNGRVGIGTTLTDNPNDYKLAVNGKIGAKEVHVENSSTTWPDYVFAKEYTLPSLLEVEVFIRENNHLKDVPSAEEVEKNGHGLGEMDAILLRKIEELTLYMIELKKENEALKVQLDSIQKK